MENYLGLDFGTQSVKALMIDAASGKLVGSSSAPLELISRDDGTREQLAEWWLNAFRHCLSQFNSEERNAVVAIGVSGQQHGFVPLGDDGQVLAPVKLWCDTSAAAECQQIMTDFGGIERCISEVGNAILPGYTAPKIRWLKNNRPEIYQQLKTILLPHDYINFYLTGELAMECGDASGTGLLDVRQRTWHREMLSALDADRDLSKCLPPLVEADAIIGTLSQSAADELGLSAGIPVSAGGGDNMMGAIGTGNVVPGKLTVSLGTSGTIYAYSDSPIIDESGAVAAFCDSTGGWLPLLCTMNCTVATELTRDLFQWPLGELDKRIQCVPPGANGVVTLPFFNGERTPNLPNGKGCILGLDVDNYTPDNLMRSAMESAVFGLRIGLDVLRDKGCEINSILVTGGGSKSASWRQMIADVFNLPVTVQKVDEGAALGAALQALWAHKKSLGEPVELEKLTAQYLVDDPDRACIPDSASVEAYQKFYRRYLHYVEGITPLYIN